MPNLMPPVYDVALIGAGPAVVSALSVMPSDYSVVVLTGSSHKQTRNRIHNKIRVVADERGEIPGVANCIPFAGEAKGELYDTATIGGLANYWGQQFLSYCEEDPWPKSIFSTFASYERSCARIGSLFKCSPTRNANPEHARLDNYVTRTPTLLVGTAQVHDAGLSAMRETFLRLVSCDRTKVLHERAVRFETVRDHVVILLEDGTNVTAKRLFVGAGAVGTLRLAMASCPDVVAVRLSDHAPYLVYAAGLARRVPLDRCDGLIHFNSLSIERIENDRVSLFASAYRMSHAPFALTLASLGLPAWFKTLRTPRLFDVVSPLQIWTPDSLVQYRLDRDSARARIVGRADRMRDLELRRFQRWLLDRSYPLYLSETPPGHGFHYHAAEVSKDGNSFVPITDFFLERFGDRVLCIDSAILKTIGCRPPSLTSMAAAGEVVQSALRLSPDPQLTASSAK